MLTVNPSTDDYSRRDLFRRQAFCRNLAVAKAVAPANRSSSGGGISDPTFHGPDPEVASLMRDDSSNHHACLHAGYCLDRRTLPGIAEQQLDDKSRYQVLWYRYQGEDTKKRNFQYHETFSRNKRRRLVHG
jgi:hypothetical protein